MSKSSQIKKTESMSLGTKRVCPDCKTKFYDFGKEEIQCPKCNSTIDPEEVTKLKPTLEPKKKEKPVVEDPLIQSEDDNLVSSSEEEDMMESLEDLEEEELVEDLAVDEEEQEEY